MIQVLQEKEESDLTLDFEITDHIYAKAKVSGAKTVMIWCARQKSSLYRHAAHCLAFPHAGRRATTCLSVA